MRLKPVPEPPRSPSTVGEVQSALPLVPGSEEDCCARVVRRTDVDDPDVARDWITFLRALELVDRHDAGYARRRTDPERSAMAAAFRDRVFGAREVLDALAAAEGSLAPEDVLDRIEEAVPEWERGRHRDWRAEWTARVERLLSWAVLFGLADRGDGGYRRRKTESDGDQSEDDG